MPTDLPQGSLPPPNLPSTVLAEARIRTLEADLVEETEPRQQAALCYEIAALYEGALANVTTALERHREAVERAPDFGPALHAMARIYRVQGNHAAVAGALAQLQAHAKDVDQRASLACERGVVLYDMLGDEAGAVELWERALSEDPACVTAALLLENHYRSTDATADAERVTELRARAAADPALKAALLLELAELRQRDGEDDAALELLETAAELSDMPELAWSALERAAARGGHPAERVRALEARAQLAEDEGRAEEAAAMWREGARLRALHGRDVEGSLAAYERALTLTPDDVLLRTERMLVWEMSGDAAGATAEARGLLELEQSGPQASALHARLSEMARADGNEDAWIAQLEKAVAADPAGAAACAALERAYLELGKIDEPHDHLVARAERVERAARAELYLRAATVALHGLADARAAVKLFKRARAARDDERVVRELYTAATAAGDARSAIEAAERLCAHDITPEEREALTRDRYQRMRFELELPEAMDVLEAALGDAAGRGWAADAARLQSAQRADMPRLARSHRELARASTHDTEHAAHLCAAARAFVKAGSEEQAIACLREALAREPTNAYAVALLQALLLSRGEAREAVGMLQRAAHESRDARERELSLLYAGGAAERAGDVELAASSYAEALEVEGAGAGPRWALRRLAERHGPPARVLEALESLARWEAETGGGATARLELAEELERRGEYARAVPALLDALADDAVELAAALDLALSPNPTTDVQARDAGLERLGQRLAGEPALALTRERISWLQTRDAPGARPLLQQALARAGKDPGLALAALRDGDTERRALAFAYVARAIGGGEAATELLLHSLRISSLSHGNENTSELLMRAFRIADAAPEALTAAVALDEALAAADDPEARAHALFARLAHAGREAGLTLWAARARALLAAGRPREAADAARAVLATVPDDSSAWEVLRIAGRALADWPGVVDAADQLAARTRGELKAMLLEEAAVVLSDELGQDHEAELRLRAVFEIDAGRPVAFQRLHDLLLDKNDVEGLLDLLDQHLPAASEDEDRVDLLFERAVALRALNRRDEVLTTLASLATLDPAHLGALGLEAEVHASLKQWRSAVDALRRLAAAGAPPAQRRVARVGAADFLERKLEDLAGAYAELAALADEDAADGALYERMAGLARRAQMYGEAVEAYERAAACFEGERRADLERQAGALATRHLSDTERAIEAYRRALAANPADVESCRQLVELIEEQERLEPILDEFVDQLLARLQVEPAEPEVLRTLRDAGAWSYRREIELVALGALRAIGRATTAEREDWDELASEAGEAQPRPMSETALARLRKSLDGGRFAELGALVSGGLDALERPSPATLGVERRHRGGTTDGALGAELAALGRRFGYELAELHVGGNDPRRIEPLLQKGNDLTWVVGAAVSAPLSARERFALGEKLCALRLSVGGLLRRPVAARRQWLQAAVALGQASAAAETEARARELGKRLGRGGRRTAAALVAALEDPVAGADVYLEALEGTCRRAGLILADDPRAALEAVLGEGYDEDAITASPAALDLLRFWISRTLLSLRRELEMGP